MTNSQIRIEKVDKHYGAFHALKGIDLDIPKGGFVALVGPSGCGKSTLLRTIAGLEKITSGDMWIEDQRVNNLAPRHRDLAMVFQSYALYPHMNVRDNLTYALRLKGVSKAERAKRAEEVAAVIGLENLLDRFPRALSGGQRQRVAMGRAIIRSPKAFLFDEPLSNLDAALRVRMRKEIRALHDRIGATSVYVTHDQIEAMTMADHVVVMRAGVIEQQGAPLDLYERPANQFVAGFIGSPAMNFAPGVVAENGTSVQLLDAEIPTDLVMEAGREVIVGLRPEHITVTDPQTDGAVPVTVSAVEATGSSSYLFTDGDPELVLVTAGTSALKAGEAIGLSVAPNQVHLFDSQTQMALRSA
ncbi:MAG: sn-glycerol-3-phosphate ABC transporter ATP-binding protein UgpC [Rhizobiales bacterium]|nr:sn-glycerol-3-phosphate ABC transporter ATP-binding protein UgpC [Hyphomicrobiales bacterium]MBO6698329.1 sn-glycerol-3-phosphate ABC transporter ATP-binding protein UgpC [Hyphomicrobiales bacterium]MBO6735417.1 sn-glycerol-3-phosphate ABC transporter ATP-binding protein UgpC [Hyphomicrobiales bacterium]MBO6910775.1 sn-glycerol-3-phosphate ABC transporter ATP-binding protein UgpC [Hyphomicrobiales bacterium]MBO6956506.1 sn-glycerol-3-phosphate ABC transporter ATP-binding protein UgpC [Hyphom